MIADLDGDAGSLPLRLPEPSVAVESTVCSDSAEGASSILQRNGSAVPKYKLRRYALFIICGLSGPSENTRISVGIELKCDADIAYEAAIWSTYTVADVFQVGTGTVPTVPDAETVCGGLVGVERADLLGAR